MARMLMMRGMMPMSTLTGRGLDFLARVRLHAPCQESYYTYSQSLDKGVFVCYIIYMKRESIFTVTFTNDSTVFIKAMDEGHVHRIIENTGGLWTSGEREVEMVIKKIERSC